jgi:hypothetical protein
MATFPALQPAARNYNFGVFALTEEPSRSAGIVRFRHATTPSNYELTLEYVALSNTNSALIRTHFATQGGGYRAFPLPSIIWRGHTFSGNVTPVGLLWRYAAAPEETHLPRGRSDIRVELVSDGTVDRSLGEIALSFTPGTATGA